MIAAGGTGGHFYPGLVTAQALAARGWEPLLVVRKDDPALGTLADAGLPALPVDLRGLPRRPGPELLSFAWKLGGSMRLLARALRSFRPDLALGMGGYLSFPLLFAAWRRGLPRAVHESNAALGLANRAVAALGAEVFWGLPPESGEKGAVVGTPIRPALWKRREPGECRRALGLDPARPVLLVFGGSQGAQGVNRALPPALKSLALPGLQVLHLAGKGKAEDAARAYRQSGVAADVREYLEDMGAAYGAADLTLCRAGASTLAELAAQRAPAVLVPYPHAAGDHQSVNARVFERAGAALRVPESELGAALGPMLDDLLKSDGAARRRKDMSESYARLGLPPASDAVSALVEGLERLIA